MKAQQHWQRIHMAPIGAMHACIENGALTVLKFAAEDAALPTASVQCSAADKLFVQLQHELERYFAGELTQFSLPLRPQGTPFQQAVWAALEAIPYGATWSCKTLAETVGRPKGYQAVGQANGKNPIVILIPCHRVIAADGRLGGYGGGLPRKKQLLAVEKSTWR